MPDSLLTNIAAVSEVTGPMELYVNVPGSPDEDGKATATQVKEFASAVDSTGYKVLDGVSDLQGLADATDEALLAARATGLISGGGLSDLGSGVVRIAAGMGQILDNTTPANPSFARVSWAQEDIDLGDTDDRYWIYADESGDLIATTTEPSHADYRTKILLWRVVIRGGAVSGYASVGMSPQQVAGQIWDLFRALPIMKRGLEVSPVGSGLGLAIAAGEIYGAGINFHNNPLNPHEATYDAESPVTFRMVDRNNIQGTDTTSLDVGQWDNNGTVEAIPGSGSRVTIFTVFKFGGATGNVRVLYGQAWYQSLVEASAALRDYAPVVPDNFQDAVVIAYVLAQKASTDLSDEAQALFSHTGEFGSLSRSVPIYLSNYVLKGPIGDSGLTMATGKMLGRNTAGTGPVEEIDQVSSGERTAGTETALRGFSPADIASMAATHGGGGGGGIDSVYLDASQIIPRVTAGGGIDTQETATYRINRDGITFDAITQEYGQAWFPWPTGWATATATFFWNANAASGSAVWGAQMRSWTDGDALDSDFGTAQEVTDAVGSANTHRQTSATASITPSGTVTAGKLVCLQLYRDPANGSDDLAAEAILSGVLIQKAS